jgi:hypothetical protein
MCIIDCRKHRDSCRGSHVLIAVFVDHVLNAIRLMIGVIAKDRIMNWPSCPLKSSVRIKIEIPLERRCNITFNQTARQRISLLIAGPRSRECSY